MQRPLVARMMEAAPYTLDRFEMKADPSVRLLNDDVAVLAYGVREELTVDGEPLTLEASDASTWVRRGDAWLCALHTESLSGDPFGRDRKPKEKEAAPRPAGNAADDERAIRDLIKTWIEASRKGDLQTLLGLMADDMIFMVPGREPFGKEEFARSAGKGAALLEAKSEVKEIAVMGDWAWCRTKLAVTLGPGGKKAQRSGYTLSILRKNADGRWVLARDANLLT